MDQEHVIKKTKEIIPVIQKRLSLDFLFLFGSHVKGKANEDSDIDIAVVSSDIPPGILNDDVTNTLIDIHDIDWRFEPHFFRTEKWNLAPEESFIDRIKKTGIVIYQNGL